MTQGGQTIKAWYSSTHGGYAFPTSELPGWSATAWTKRVTDTTTGAVGSVDFAGGRVNSVTVSGDAGGSSFSGSEFKDWFNLRAPANIQIVGPLFNIERN